MLTRKLGVPVGILNSSWGGTRIEPWTTPEGFKSVEKTQDIYERLQMRNPTTDQYKKALREFLVKLGTWETLAQESLEKGVHWSRCPRSPPTLIPYSDRHNHQLFTMACSTQWVTLQSEARYGIRGGNRSEGMMYYERRGRWSMAGGRSGTMRPSVLLCGSWRPIKYGDANRILW